MSKEKEQMSMYGIGPVYVCTIIILTVAAVCLRDKSLFSSGRLLLLRFPVFVIGVIMICMFFFMWIHAVLISKVDDGIKENRLVTTGIYACVRNPIYSAFLFLCTGILLIIGNAYFMILPLFYWALMTVLLKHTEERWLLERFGKEYEDYCSRVNRCIPWIPDKDAVYESDISNARWMVYDVLGNAGWIAYFIVLALCFVKKPEFMEYWGMFGITELAVIPALLMFIGIVELISERILKLDLVLPRYRLVRGFGALTLGGFLGALIALCGIVYGLLVTDSDIIYMFILFAGGIFCGVFAWLLYKRYKRK